MIINKEQAESFVKNSSQNGVLTLYGFSTSLEKKISFDRVDFVKKVFKEANSPDYSYGYLVACFALEIINFNFKDLIITPTFIDLEIDKEMKLLLNRFKEDSEYVRDKMESIDKYFTQTI